MVLLIEANRMVADAYAVEPFAVLPNGENQVEIQRCG
jgi:hypothetical protein